MIKFIKLKEETKKRLDSVKHVGQTYDGIISELVEEKKRKIKKGGERIC